MIFKLAYRNLLRNPRRSIIVLTSIVIGVVFAFLFDSFSKGMIYQMLDDQISSYNTEMKVFAKDYYAEKDIEFSMEYSQELQEKLNSADFIKQYAPRLEATGLISSPGASGGVLLAGLDAEKEKNLIRIPKEGIKEGAFLSGKKGEILISTRTAEKLEVELDDKIVAVVNQKDGSVVSELFRVCGLYKSSNSLFDKTTAFINLDDAQAMLEMPGEITSIGMYVNERDNIKENRTALENILGKKYEVMSYYELLPTVLGYIEMYNQMIYVIYLLVIIAVLFGMINSMLMSVYERTQEIGVLMAIGMKKGKIFRMILGEAFVLGLVGSVIGSAIAVIINIPLSIYGINLSMAGDSLESMGFASIIYCRYDAQVLISSLFLMPIGTMIGAIYPAMKALKLQPTDAMRYI